MKQKYDEEIVRYFIQKDKKERYLYMLTRSKHRRAVINELYDLNDFEPESVSEVPRTLCDAQNIYAFLKSKGAGDAAYVISASTERDGQIFPLLDALEDCVGYGVLTLVYCFKTKIGYCQTDGSRCFLLDKALQ